MDKPPYKAKMNVLRPALTAANPFAFLGDKSAQVTGRLRSQILLADCHAAGPENPADAERNPVAVYNPAGKNGILLRNTCHISVGILRVKACI